MRITAGKLRGIKFDFPKNKDTRPTSSLVRLSIFNTIGVNNIEGKLVLDMFAGSGSLGIEALSRNAKHVDFVEMSKINCMTLKKNLHLLEIENLTNIYCQKVEIFLSENKTKYDTILMDPPYKLNSLNETLDLLAHSSILKKKRFFDSPPLYPIRYPCQLFNLSFNICNLVLFYSFNKN